MGAACMMGFGLALARPDKHVLVVTGDGELLMNLGSLANIAVFNPSNLSIVCVDNGHYGETGYQKSHTSLGVDLERSRRAPASGAPHRCRASGSRDGSRSSTRATAPARTARVETHRAGRVRARSRWVALRDGFGGAAIEGDGGRQDHQGNTRMQFTFRRSSRLFADWYAACARRARPMRSSAPTIRAFRSTWPS